jgi:hypothetical protein
MYTFFSIIDLFIITDAAEIMEKKEFISMNSSSNCNGNSENITQSKLLTGARDSVSNSKQAIPSTSGPCQTGSEKDPHYRTFKKEMIDSEDSSNDSLPDPCLNINLSKPASLPATSSGGLSSSALKTQSLSSSLNFKQRLNKSPDLPLHKTGPLSVERLTSAVEGQRTRFLSEPSQPIFSLIKTVKKTETIVKPAKFSPIKSMDEMVASGSKKTTAMKPAVYFPEQGITSVSSVDRNTSNIIKPATFSPKNKTTVSSLDTKSPNIIKPAVFYSNDQTAVSTAGTKKSNIIKPATFSPKKDNAQEVDNGTNVAFVTKPCPNSEKIVVRGVYIKPATFSPNKGAQVVHSVPDIVASSNWKNLVHPAQKSTVSCLPSTSDILSEKSGTSSDTSLTTSMMGDNVYRKMSSGGTTKVAICEEKQQDSGTKEATEALSPAGLEGWKCVTANARQLDDEQTYRREILFKSGEVMGKIENERRKSVGRIQVPKSTEGTSSKPQASKPSEGTSSKPQASKSTAGSNSNLQTPKPSAVTNSNIQAAKSTEGTSSKPQAPKSTAVTNSNLQAAKSTAGTSSKPQAPKSTAGANSNLKVLKLTAGTSSNLKVPKHNEGAISKPQALGSIERTSSKCQFAVKNVR